MTERVYTKSSEGDLRQQQCECCVCREVSRCTPSFDFYTTPLSGDYLVCERCFYADLPNRIAHSKRTTKETA